jgi:hypothetical protein
MTATEPISMHVHDLYSDTHTAWVIQSHVLAMYAPSLISGPAHRADRNPGRACSAGLAFEWLRA